MNRANKLFLDLDERLCLKLNGLAGRKVIDRVSYVISKLGDGSIYFFFLGVFIVFFKKPAFVMCRDYLSGGLINHIIYKLIKNKVKRKRPFTTLEAINKIMPPPDEFSFPSGHSGGASLFFFFTLHHMSSTIAMISLVWMILIGLSRVYNGVHYPGDVLAGYIMGGSVAKGLLFLYNI